LGIDRWRDPLIACTFAAAGLAPVLPRLMELPILDQIPYLHFLVFLPAVLIGGLYWLAAPSTLRVAPMIAIIAVMILGLGWTDASERGRGVYELALVATPLPLAALIQRRREWLLGMTAYILASTVAAIYLFYDWMGQAERTGLNTDRYGGLYNDRIERIMEPNITATHLAFGALLVVALWLLPAPGAVERRLRNICTFCSPVLAAGVVLSASRGGVLSLLGALGALVVMTSVRRSWRLRANTLAILGLAAAVVLLLLAPNPVSDRLTPGSEVTQISEAPAEPNGGPVTETVASSSTRSFGGRTDIWKAALEASGSSRSTMLIGAGTGGADHAVAVANPNLPIAKVGEHDVIRANAHNTYLYWLVSFGALGMIVGGVTLGSIAWFAIGNDWRQNWGVGTAMLAFFLLTSVTLIANRLEITSIAVSALTLGYILPAPEHQIRTATPRAWWGRFSWN
jgi:O-antigen ligase